MSESHDYLSASLFTAMGTTWCLLKLHGKQGTNQISCSVSSKTNGGGYPVPIGWVSNNSNSWAFSIFSWTTLCGRSYCMPGLIYSKCHIGCTGHYGQVSNQSSCCLMIFKSQVVCPALSKGTNLLTSFSHQNTNTLDSPLSSLNKRFLKVLKELPNNVIASVSPPGRQDYKNSQIKKYISCLTTHWQPFPSPVKPIIPSSPTNKHTHIHFFWNFYS